MYCLTFNCKTRRMLSSYSHTCCTLGTLRTTFFLQGVIFRLTLLLLSLLFFLFSRWLTMFCTVGFGPNQPSPLTPLLLSSFPVQKRQLGRRQRTTAEQPVPAPSCNPCHPVWIGLDGGKKAGIQAAVHKRVTTTARATSTSSCSSMVVAEVMPHQGSGLRQFCTQFTAKDKESPSQQHRGRDKKEEEEGER